MYKWDRLSVFFPAYNEETNLQNTITKAVSYLNSSVRKWEIIIVDDGSTDKTGAIADHLAKTIKNIRVIHNQPNLGYGGALQSGFYNSRMPWIAFTDADGQFDISELELFFQNQKETHSDAVIGFYLTRSVTKMTVLTSRMWEFLVLLLFGLRVRDIDCGLKLLSKKIINTIPHLKAQRGAFISSELLIKTKKYGFKITEVGVHHFPRKSGQGTGRNLKVIFGSFMDLFRLWWNLVWVN